MKFSKYLIIIKYFCKEDHNINNLTFQSIINNNVLDYEKIIIIATITQRKMLMSYQII